MSSEGPPPVVFRCDGSDRIGLGHIMRCRSLALALKARGCRCTFAMQDLPGSGAALLQADGWPVRTLAGAPAGPGGLSRDDLDQTLALAGEIGARAVLVDHYGAAAGYVRAIQERGLISAVIDDIGDRDLSGADWILNQNLDAPGYGRVPDAERTVLSGPRYALLRPEFARARAGLARVFSAGDRRVLVTLGGGETVGLAVSVLHGLEAVERRLVVRCLGGNEPRVHEVLRAQAAQSRHTVEILPHIEDMAGLMAWADLSINGGGSTCWEGCCLGVPMVVLVLSADQAPIAQALERTGAATGAPCDGAARAAGALLADPARRGALSAAARALVDGEGAGRAADSLIAQAGRLKKTRT